MANQPKKYQKFVATAATATLVATAVVPAASADTKFSDISKYAKDVQEEILFLADLGVITGFQDGTFKPAQNITRGQTVKMLGRFLVENGYEEVPANWETEQSFEDIALNRTDRDLVKYAAVVKAAGVFKGDGNVLNPSGFTTRENMALILDRLAQQITGKTAVEIAKAAGLTGEVSDLAKAKEEAREAISALNALGVSNANEFKPKSNTQRVHFASFLARAIELFEDQVDKTPTIESVQALSKTKVVVTFNTPVDEVAKENFTIEGAKVDGVTLSEDKKTATLEVSGLEYATKYTVAIKDVKVDGKAVDFGSKEFTTPAVTNDFTLRVTPTATTVTADGADNTVVKFELLNSLGEVDTNADNMVLEIGSTFGNLANSRVTVQDGVGQVVLSSEFSTKEVIAKVTAQIIEASSDYKDLIGKVAGEATVKFVPSAATTDPDLVTFVDAESNQADRVVLYFDKAVSPETFVVKNTDGTFKTTADGKKQILKPGVEIGISQDGDTAERGIVGVVAVPGNDKAIEVLLEKDHKLKDNAKVNLDVKIGKVQNKKSFTLTDARKPEFTGVTAPNLRTLDLKFSEAVLEGNFSIDGVWFDGKEFTTKLGDFNAKTGVDSRDTATIELGSAAGKQLYFKAGQHSITVTQLKDFAAATDAANVSTTQTLNFNVAADVSVPVPTATVESPEQFRVAFDKDIQLANVGENADALFNAAFKVFDVTKNEWVALKDLEKVTGKDANGKDVKVKVFDQSNAKIAGNTLLKASNKFLTANQYVIELTEDWSKLVADKNDTYHNYQFKLDIPADKFENVVNGKTNVKADLALSYAGSALTTADNASPVISDIVKSPIIKENLTITEAYEVVMNEPVKLNNSHADNAGDTPSLSQTAGIPTVLAELQGKDANGKAVVYQAKIEGYSDLDGADKKFKIVPLNAAGGELSLQTLVNQGHNENWTVVVRSISDDIGNTAATLTKDFLVEREAAAAIPFQIESNENINPATGNPYTNQVFAYNAEGEGQDRLEVTFTKAVNFAGNDNLAAVNNWTLNGTKLSQLSNVASIKLENVPGKGLVNDYEKVIITFADDRAFGKTSNVVSVTKGITSLDGTVLTGEFEVVAETRSVVVEDPAVTAAKKALTDAITAGKAVDTTGKTAESVKALTDAIAAGEATLAKADVTETELKAAAKAITDAQTNLKDEVPTVTLADVNFIETENIFNATYIVTIKATEADKHESLKGKTLSITVDGKEYKFEPNKINKENLNITVAKADYDKEKFAKAVIVAK